MKYSYSVRVCLVSVVFCRRAYAILSNRRIIVFSLTCCLLRLFASSPLTSFTSTTCHLLDLSISDRSTAKVVRKEARRHKLAIKVSALQIEYQGRNQGKVWKKTWCEWRELGAASNEVTFRERPIKFLG